MAQSPAQAVSLEQACQDISSMRVRGASLIGTTAARALADHVAATPGDLDVVLKATLDGARRLEATRPTAVTLHHALGKVVAGVRGAADGRAAREAALDAAQAWQAWVEATRAAVAQRALALVPKDACILTHCHSSTVVDVLVEAHRAGRSPSVVCTETRPFGQGRLTARSLAAAEVPVTFVVDSAADALLQEGVDRVLVGADTVTRDGSVFNKVGTAGVARLAGAHGVPVACAATSDKFHRAMPQDVAIEQRAASEVWPNPPAGVVVHNRVFDRTAPELVGAFATEHGIHRADEAVRRALAGLPPDWEDA